MEKPKSGATYVRRTFDLTGMSLKGSTFRHCIVTVRDNGPDTLISKCRFEECLLFGDWPTEMTEAGPLTPAEWAAKHGLDVAEVAATLH